MDKFNFTISLKTNGITNIFLTAINYNQVWSSNIDNLILFFTMISMNSIFIKAVGPICVAVFTNYMVSLISTPEKTQLAKQKNNFGSKRGDRRNLKASMKTKYDSFSVKAGLASFSLAGGGNNFFGMIQSRERVFLCIISFH